MKSDVLSGFKTIKVCTSYNYKGEEINYLPYDLDDKLITPNYVELEGWEEDISCMSSMSTMPKAFLKYIDFLEKKLNKPISIISVGPDRSQTIFK